MIGRMIATICRRVSTTLAVAVALAACSSPAPVLYTVAPVPGATIDGAPRVILLQQIVLASYLERQQIVRSSENYRLDVLSNDWWGETPSAMLGRVLLDELGSRLPGSTVLSESGGISSSPDATIAVNIQRMDKDIAGNLILQAQAGVEFKGKGAPQLRGFRFSVTPPAAGTAGEVAAISTAIGQLADGLAAMLPASSKKR
jgi:uncharacterized lipoprotein YmbA